MIKKPDTIIARASGVIFIMNYSSGLDVSVTVVDVFSYSPEEFI